MNNRMSRVSIFLAGAALVLGLASAGFAGPLSSFDAAMSQAKQRELPIMLKVGAEWCKYCKEFDEVAASDAALSSMLMEKVVFCAIDGEKDGAAVAKRYNVHSFPSFIVTNADGEVMDRWGEWNGAEKFTSALNTALADPTTVDQKKERFAENPTEADAAKLAQLSSYEGSYGDAVAYYRRAAALGSDESNDYDADIFESMVRGVWRGIYSSSDVTTQADVVFASQHCTPEEMIEVVYGLRKAGIKTGDQELHLSYLKTTVEATEGVGGEKVQRQRAKLLPDYALHIEKDKKKAVKYHKEILPEDWQQNANMLNNFAWWCFENEINLDEAEDCARRGIELAKAGREKANILDTLAEICNVKGDCGDAVEYIQLAIKEDPENEYFQRQQERFTKLLAQMEQGN